MQYSRYEEEKLSVTTSRTGSTTTAQSKVNQSFVSAQGFLRPNREPRVMADDGNDGSSANRVLTQDLVQIMRSKQDIYKILTITGQIMVTLTCIGQYYLPPFNECTVDFMRDVFSGRKLVSVCLLTPMQCLLNSELKIVTVPRLTEFAVA